MSDEVILRNIGHGVYNLIELGTASGTTIFPKERLLILVNCVEEEQKQNPWKPRFLVSMDGYTEEWNIVPQQSTIIILSTSQIEATRPIAATGYWVTGYVALQQSPPSPLVPEELRSDYLRTCRQTIAVWLDAFPEDFYQPPEHRLLSNLSTFLEEHCPDPQLQAKVKNLLERNPIAAHDEDGSFVPGSGTGSDSDSGLGLPRCVSPLPSSLLNTVRYSNFMDIPSETVAEQITRMDADCFRRLLPHQCLGAIWSKKAAHPERCASVRACVDHFNAVSFRVLSTVLTDSDIRPSQRAKVIAKWIEVAQELRLLKNFSSLKAIISGLQSTPIYRLRKVWLSVPREKVELFEELSRLVSEENNQSVPRELLIREGTSKTAQVISDRDKQLPRAIMKQSSSHALRGVRYGTIPYLGTFLTDLNMVDTAHPNTIGPKNLINFDKRRKEFEILAQIKLLQGSASAYSIPVDDRFTRWFDACPSLDDKAAFELSCLIEPQGQPHGHSHSPGYLPPTPGRRNKPSHAPSITRHQKSDSIASNSSGASSGPGAAELSDSMTSATDGVSFDRKMSTSSSCSSLPSLDVSLVSSTAAPQSPTTTLTTTANTPATKNRPPFNSSRSTPTGCKYEDSSPTASSPHPPHTRQSFLSSKSKSSAQLLTPSSKSQDISSSSTPSPYRTPEYYIIRVSIEDPASEQQGVNLYKSIMLSNNERTPAVIRNAMLKHGIEGKADEYTLAQILPHGEMVFPSTGNVYYAINTSHDLNFILRRKKPGEEIQKTGIRMREVNSRGAHAKKKLINLMT
ncbi:unnamed protein product [Cyprideis torosa]|uniref:Uncharacterized protein n=1 Tax=Cyprideis torosa TaxID=163714 RepID=A0A7R8WAR6_9CRUS|nr:unnamed protein product [Cyprideis torosa]CAG0891347.1 unnamed protein product [Cyprideis torosa]